MSIPKILHYCWFGRKPLPPEAQAFIQGWKERMPEYQVVEWNESNFDIGCCTYVRQAYDCGKFAFVSDYARGLALYHVGGIYLDTDVELLKSLDPFLNYGAFFGFEYGDFVATSTMGAAPGHVVFKEYLDQYQGRHFSTPDGGLDQTTNVVMLTALLVARGLKRDGTFQQLEEGITCHPKAVFSPYDYADCLDFRTPDTVAIHHYAQSWLGPFGGLRRSLKRFIAVLPGGRKLLGLSR